MNWGRVILYVSAVLLLPELIGFLFGFSSMLWQDAIATETAYWVRVVLIAILLFAIFMRLTIVQEEKKLVHLIVVLLISEAIIVAIEIVFSVSADQILAGLGANLLIFLLAVLFGLHLVRKRAQP